MADLITLAVFAIVWGTPAYFVGQYAARRRHSPVVFFLVSVFTSPLVAYLFAKHLPEGDHPAGPVAPAEPLAGPPADDTPTRPAYAAPTPPASGPQAYARDASRSLAGSKPPPSSS